MGTWTWRYGGAAALLGGAVGACTMPVRGDSFNYLIPNGSFELPRTLFVSTLVPSWQKAPQPAWWDGSSGYAWEQLVGIFANTAPGSSNHIDNLDGTQAAWLFAVPEVEAFQDLAARYQAGRSYHLSASVIGGGGGMLLDVPLEVRLYYRDPSILSGDNRVTIAAATVSNTNATGTAGTHFVEVTVTTPAVAASDPWLGQLIGVQVLSTVSAASQGGYWDLDNVRLTVDLPAGLKAGDTNGDGQITLDDYLGIDAGYRGLAAAEWAHGDFDGDGLVTASDYAIIDAAFLAQGGDATAANGLTALHATWFGAGAGTAAVPEPATLALLGMAGAVLAWRRSRGSRAGRTGGDKTEIRGRTQVRAP